MLDQVFQRLCLCCINHLAALVSYCLLATYLISIALSWVLLDSHRLWFSGYEHAYYSTRYQAKYLPWPKLALEFVVIQCIRLKLSLFVIKC